MKINEKYIPIILGISTIINKKVVEANKVYLLGLDFHYSGAQKNL